jgi:hypothetical protein
VVSTPMPEVLRYAPAVQTAETPDQFIAACAAALTASRTSSAASRRELVRQEGWRARVEQLSQVISCVEGEAGRTEPALASVG